ncbi:hypothetical protein FHS31_002818 [Sphingomonas vulcanisoli]|uniref:XRE family transcriptional regulator n=1 Tax=Sphingomonas vulcanisoli TaxID=1658060 RepID=A0ABX0TUQ7_9SPHN|nr:hypothetical protein [Sphingomonas vulcanisoli]NIJ09186.1 hypothetical protein [Sphingomonas vulcanisoli]
MGILQEIEGYLRAHHMTPSRFGRLVVNDPHLIRGLRAGRRLRRDTAERIERFLKDEEAAI